MTRTKTKTVDRKYRSEHISKPEHRAEHIKTITTDYYDHYHYYDYYYSCYYYHYLQRML